MLEDELKPLRHRRAGNAATSPPTDTTLAFMASRGLHLPLEHNADRSMSTAVTVSRANSTPSGQVPRKRGRRLTSRALRRCKRCGRPLPRLGPRAREAGLGACDFRPMSGSVGDGLRPNRGPARIDARPMTRPSHKARDTSATTSATSRPGNQNHLPPIGMRSLPVAHTQRRSRATRATRP